MAAGVPRPPFDLMAVVLLALEIVLPAAAGQAPAPPPTGDGTSSLHQGIAYLLMLVALVLTYLIHPLDASSRMKLF